MQFVSSEGQVQLLSEVPVTEVPVTPSRRPDAASASVRQFHDSPDFSDVTLAPATSQM